MSEQKIERNKEIYFQHSQGIPHKQIAANFGISRERVEAILQQERRYINMQFDEIPEIWTACEEFCDNQNSCKAMYSRIINVLANKRLLHNNKWTKLSEDEILGFFAFGRKATDILLRAIELKTGTFDE